jgi:hypothetical protein
MPARLSVDPDKSAPGFVALNAKTNDLFVLGQDGAYCQATCLAMPNKRVDLSAPKRSACPEIVNGLQETGLTTAIRATKQIQTWIKV